MNIFLIFLKFRTKSLITMIKLVVGFSWRWSSNPGVIDVILMLAMLSNIGDITLMLWMLP